MLAEQYQRVNVNIARKELLALEYVSQHSRHYLYGLKSIVRTDQSALKWLMSF